MTADESIMDSWLLYTQMWKIPGESLKKSVHGLAASIENRFGNSELVWECLLNSNSVAEIELNLNWDKQNAEMQFEFKKIIQMDKRKKRKCCQEKCYNVTTCTYKSYNTLITGS